MRRQSTKRAPLRNLKSHPEAYVTTAELAGYWVVNRKQIYKQIEAGTLRAIRLGPRLWRIRTSDAIEFEHRADMHAPEGPKVMAKASVDKVKVRAAGRR